VHTAVKISPHYEGPVVYVPDASRAVGVCSELLSDERAAAYIAELKADIEKTRALHASKKQTPLVTLAEARANKARLDLSRVAPAPKFIGRRMLKNLDLAELARYIDWGPFFQTWDLAGPYPAILDDEVVGSEARKVFADAQAMLKKIIDGRWLQAHAVFGLYPAARVHEDDIAIRSEPPMVWHGLRMQTERPVVEGVKRPNRCLSDFVAEEGDHVGLFAVTAGLGVDRKEADFLATHDDYSAIMLKALADRLAEAAAEWLHERVRREFWGYAPAEALSNEALIAEKYQGIRPAPGYPACPEHTEKGPLFELLQAPKNAGITLTESYAMLPTAAVSGFYFSHPQAQYFATGKVDKDQVADYAKRKGMTVEEAERWLAPALSY
jgi:5-methyltetrahydrofolate--homocysteine methyltransferase